MPRVNAKVNCGCWVVIINECATLVGGVVNGEAIQGGVGAEAYGTSLDLHLNFAANLKVL